MAHRTEAELSAERLMILAAQRDRAAFTPLYERYVDQIYAYAYSLTHNRELAEDVTRWLDGEPPEPLMVRAQAVDDRRLGGQADLPLRGVAGVEFVRHTKVGAEHLKAGVPVALGVIRDAGQYEPLRRLVDRLSSGTGLRVLSSPRSGVELLAATVRDTVQ